MTQEVCGAGLRLALAGGGTGGHLVPGLHLIEDLAQRGGVLEDLVWFTGGRPVEQRVLAGLADLASPAPVRVVPLRLESRAGGAPGKLRQAMRLGPSAAHARRVLRDHRSQVLLGLGGFVCGPAVVGAAAAGVPRALLEINAHAGQATRLLGRISQRVLHAWPATMPGTPGQKHVLTGAPLGPRFRPPTRAERTAARRELGLDPDRPMLLVLGGSQGAGALNDYVLEHGPKLVEQGCSIVLQTGQGKLPAQGPAGDHWLLTEYLPDVPTALYAASVALTRGGASTLAEVDAVALPAWVVPYPHHADRHQESNARQLGAGVQIVAEAELDASLLKRLADALQSKSEQRDSPAGQQRASELVWSRLAQLAR